MIAGWPDAATFATICICAALSIVAVVGAALAEQRDRDTARSDRRVRRELARHPFDDLTDDTTMRLVRGRREGDDE